MFWRAFIIAMLAASGAFAQEQAPPAGIAGLGVRSSLSTADPAAMLARARVKVAAITHRLQKYTCLETIERAYFTAPAEKANPNPAPEANSCDQKEFGKNGHLSLAARSTPGWRRAASTRVRCLRWCRPGRSVPAPSARI